MTQLGNQDHSSESIRLLCEYIWAGAIGNVTETYSWARTGRGGIGGRLPTKPVPAGLHWDEWIGPAAYRDYHEKLHPKLWRSWWEFGDGSVGDWGCHNLDGPFMALKLGSPTSVEALEQFGGSDERYPLRNAIRWNFPARGDMPPVKVIGTTASRARSRPWPNSTRTTRWASTTARPSSTSWRRSTAASSATAARSSSATRASW